MTIFDATFGYATEADAKAAHPGCEIQRHERMNTFLGINDVRFAPVFRIEMINLHCRKCKRTVEFNRSDFPDVPSWVARVEHDKCDLCDDGDRSAEHWIAADGSEPDPMEMMEIDRIKGRRYECFMEDHEAVPWTPGRCAGYAGRGSLALHLFRCKRHDGHGLGGLFCSQHAKTGGF